MKFYISIWFFRMSIPIGIYRNFAIQMDRSQSAMSISFYSILWLMYYLDLNIVVISILKIRLLFHNTNLIKKFPEFIQKIQNTSFIHQKWYCPLQSTPHRLQRINASAWSSSRNISETLLSVELSELSSIFPLPPFGC